MRVSVDKNDPGYGPVLARVCCILLDGKPLEWCYTADEEMGLAIVYVRRPDGKLAFDGAGNAIRETLHGRVQIRISPGSGHA